jgi:hypothetical protein
LFPGDAGASVPGPEKPFHAVAHLVNGLGDVALRLTVVRLDTSEPVYEARGLVSFSDRMQEIRFHVLVGQCEVPKAGGYGVMLWAEGELIAQSDFNVWSRKEGQNGHE